MKIEMKSLEANLNLASDVQNVSKIFLVFNEKKPTEIFNALKQCAHDLEVTLKRYGILTEHGVGVYEMEDYIEYLTDIAEYNHLVLKELYVAIEDLKSSGISAVGFNVISKVLEDKIDSLWEDIDLYESIYKEVKIKEATLEDWVRPQTIVRGVDNEKD